MDSDDRVISIVGNIFSFFFCYEVVFFFVLVGVGLIFVV